MEIGERIKAVRKFRNMTQSELSDGIVTRNMLSEIENGKAMPSTTLLKEICLRLEISADYLLFGNEDGISGALFESKLPYFNRLFKNKNFNKLITETEPFKGIKDVRMSLLRAKSFLQLFIEAFLKGNTEKYTEYYNSFKDILEHSDIGLKKNLFDLPDLVVRDFSDGKIPFVAESFQMSCSISEAISYFYIINLIDRGMPERAAAIYDTLKLRYEPIRLHINSKLAAANMNFERAKELLGELTEKYKHILPVPLMLVICKDYEQFCTKTSDYEKAYECRLYRISLSEGK